MNTMQLEVKEVIKTEVEIWRMQSLDVALALEFKAKDKTEEIKSEFEIEEIKMDEFKCEGEIWKLKKLWVQKAEVDKSGNEETWI